MNITIERIDDLFDKEIVDEMLEPIDKVGCCHYNAGKVCMNFYDWQCINYVEGYLKEGHIGHAINSYEDENGGIHYFDVTQEYYIKKGFIKNFDSSFDVVKILSSDEINELFTKDGYTHLVAVEIMK